MITAPAHQDNHLCSAWTVGIAALFLAIGLSGAVMPLVPVARQAKALEALRGDPIMVEEFDPPPSPATAEDTATEPPETAPEPDMDVPPVPEITEPLTPPEMPEITPLEAVREQPKPPPSDIKPAVKPAVPKPRPAVPATGPAASSGNPTAKPGASTTAAGKPGGSGRPSLFTGSGKGRFPQPAYPSAARRDGLQGSVRLSVTVEAGGLPSAVGVMSSSGHAVLDAAARDQVQRRWRWPAGEVRQFVIPIRFVLQ